MIRVDVSAVSIVVACSRCHWRTMADDRPGAWRLGLRHDLAIHPEDRPAIHAAHAALARTRKPPPALGD